MNDFRTNVAQPLWWHRLGDMQSFQAMEKLLAEHCPDVVLKTHRGARIGLSVRASQITEKVAGTMLVTLPIAIISPAAALVASQTTKLWEAAGKTLSNEIFKPLSSEKVQASVFRLFHNS